MGNLTTTPGMDNANPMRRTLMIIGVAIIVFLAFTTYSVQKSIQSSAQLADIKDLYFPVLERIDANIVRLDKMAEKYLQSVMMGEKDLLDQAGEIQTQADKSFEEMASLYPAQASKIGELRNAFRRYKETATGISLDLLDRKSEDLTERTTQMAQSLTNLRKSVKDFRELSYGNFVQTLNSTQTSVSVNLYMGLALGLMNLCFMGVLVYFMRNNVKMLGVIALQNATLEQRVAERTAQLTQKTNDINAMLQNMKLGVCTVVPGSRIHPEYSDYMRTIFGINEFTGKEVGEALLGNSRLGVDTKDQITVALAAILGEESMMFAFNSHLLAQEMVIEDPNGVVKILQMDWSPIVNDADIVEKVLLIVQDVTQLRALELASASQKEELDLIAQIIKISIGKFNDFIASAKKYAAENRELINQAKGKDPGVVAALFRNMHTIKGNARTYELDIITDAAHAAEQGYDLLRKDPTAEWNAARLLEDLDAVEAAIDRYIDVNENKLGRKGRASDLLTTRGAFVSNEEIADLKAAATALALQDSSPQVQQLLQSIGQLGFISLQRLVSGAVDSLSSLAKELGKPTPAVEIVNGDIAFNNLFAEALKSSFMHIVRNSMDHGIEAPEARLAAHKPEQGRLRFACEKTPIGTELHISDDGRGLALHKLYEKGLSSGLFKPDSQPSPQDVAELIFQSGLSTAEQVSMVSGRGVGMDAVRAFLHKQEADIRIVLDNPGPTLSFTAFKFVIRLPESACR